MELKDVFKRLDFPKHSDQVYEVLTKQKSPLLVNAIAKEIGVSRMVVYRCLRPMVLHQLALPQALGKRTGYVVGKVSALSKLMTMTEESVSGVAEKIAKVRQKEVPHTTRFLSGPAGIKAAFDDVIEHTPKGETFFRYTSEKDLAKVNEYLARDYRQRRDKKKLERKVISNYISGSQKRSRLERFVRFIPEEADQFQQNIIQLVYGKRVSIIDLTKEEVMIIENKALAEFQKVMFILLYKQLR